MAVPALVEAPDMVAECSTTTEAVALDADDPTSVAGWSGVAVAVADDVDDPARTAGQFGGPDDSIHSLSNHDPTDRPENQPFTSWSYTPSGDPRRRGVASGTVAKLPDE